MHLPDECDRRSSTARDRISNSILLNTIKIIAFNHKPLEEMASYFERVAGPIVSLCEVLNIILFDYHQHLHLIPRSAPHRLSESHAGPGIGLPRSFSCAFLRQGTFFPTGTSRLFCLWPELDIVNNPNPIIYQRNEATAVPQYPGGLVPGSSLSYQNLQMHKFLI